MTNIFSEIAKVAPLIRTKTVHTESEKVNNLNTDMGHCIGQSPNLDTIYQNLDLDTKSNNDELDIEIVMSKSIKFIHDNGN
jgi:hypothetical protein